MQREEKPFLGKFIRSTLCRLLSGSGWGGNIKLTVVSCFRTDRAGSGVQVGLCAQATNSFERSSQRFSWAWLQSLAHNIGVLGLNEPTLRHASEREKMREGDHFPICQVNWPLNALPYQYHQTVSCPPFYFEGTKLLQRSLQFVPQSLPQRLYLWKYRFVVGGCMYLISNAPFAILLMKWLETGACAYNTRWC